MTEPIRAFLAVDLPAEALDAVARVTDSLRRLAPGDVRWVPKGNLHLTLKFLGDVDQARLPKLERAVLGRTANTPPFAVELGGVGAFPNARAARVLWVGVGEGSPELSRLARRLDTATARLGVERERRPYRGHLTVARLRSPARVPVEQVESPPPVPVPVNEIVLYRSDLRADGARYVPLERFPLAGTPGSEFLGAHPEG